MPRCLLAFVFMAKFKAKMRHSRYGLYNKLSTYIDFIKSLPFAIDNLILILTLGTMGMLRLPIESPSLYANCLPPCWAQTFGTSSRTTKPFLSKNRPRCRDSYRPGYWNWLKWVTFAAAWCAKMQQQNSAAEERAYKWAGILIPSLIFFSLSLFCSLSFF